MSPLLPLLLGLPAAGSVVLFTVAVGARAAARTAVAVSAATFVTAVVTAGRFGVGHGGGYRDVVDVRWLAGIGVRFHLGVDGISLPLVLLTTLLVLLCVVQVIGPDHQPDRLRPLLALLLLLELGMLGTFVAADLIVFFVFFEVVLIPMYFLIAVWGGPGRGPAATKFILFTLLGSGLMLVGFLLVYASAGTFDMAALAHRRGGGISAATQVAAAVLMLIGFGVKSPMWPLHTWLPDAHTEAPTVGSVLLAGLLLKMGTYGFVRVVVGELPHGAQRIAPVLGVCGVVGIGYAAFACLAQRDLKRLIAFSSVGHMGFVLLGIATLTPVGIQAALIGNVAHGVITGLLFFLAGGVKDRFHTTDLDELGGGLLAKLPALGGLLLFASIASLGLPGLAGFWGELLSMVGAYRPGAGDARGLFLVLMAAAALGTVLTAVYFLVLLRRVDFGLVIARWRDEPLRDVVAADLVAWVPLVVLAFAVGIWPRLVLGVTDAAVHGLLR